MNPLSRLLFFVACFAFAGLLEARALAATGPAVAVEVLPGADQIDPAALRDAVARELDVPVVGTDVAAFTLVVSIDRARSELVVERRDVVGGISRRVPLPASPDQTLREAVFLIGNLARDDAADVMRGLHSHPAHEMAPAAPEEHVAEKPPAPARFWVGLSFQYDLVALPSATQVCLLPRASGYYCVAGGADFPVDASDNATIDANQSNKVAGGLTGANVRTLISMEYAATPNLLVGIRTGYVYLTYPGHAASAFPFHLEARATYLLGDAPLHHAGFAPYAMVAAGAAQWSAKVGVTVVRNSAGVIPVNGVSTPTMADAWALGGPGFVSIGAGGRWAVTPRQALLFGPRLSLAFGSNAAIVAIGPELSFQTAF